MVSQLTGIFKSISPVSYMSQGTLTQSLFLSLPNVITPIVAEMPLKHVKQSGCMLAHNFLTLFLPSLHLRPAGGHFSCGIPTWEGLQEAEWDGDWDYRRLHVFG